VDYYNKFNKTMALPCCPDVPELESWELEVTGSDIQLRIEDNRQKQR